MQGSRTTLTSVHYFALLFLCAVEKLGFCNIYHNSPPMDELPEMSRQCFTYKVKTKRSDSDALPHGSAFKLFKGNNFQEFSPVTEDEI